MIAIAAYNDEASKLQGGTNGPRYLQQQRRASPGSRSSKELLLGGVHQLDHLYLDDWLVVTMVIAMFNRIILG